MAVRPWTCNLWRIAGGQGEFGGGSSPTDSLANQGRISGLPAAGRHSFLLLSSHSTFLYLLFKFPLVFLYRILRRYEHFFFSLVPSILFPPSLLPSHSGFSFRSFPFNLGEVGIRQKTVEGSEVIPADLFLWTRQDAGRIKKEGEKERKREREKWKKKTTGKKGADRRQTGSRAAVVSDHPKSGFSFVPMISEATWGSTFDWRHQSKSF